MCLCVWSDLSFFIYYFFKLQIRSQPLVCVFNLRIAMWEIRVIPLAVLVSFLKSHTLSFPLNNMSRHQRAADSVVSLNVTFERASAARSIACFSIHSQGSAQADPTWLAGCKSCGLITLWQAAFMLLCPHKFINDSFLQYIWMSSVSAELYTQKNYFTHFLNCSVCCCLWGPKGTCSNLGSEVCILGLGLNFAPKCGP